MSERDDSIKRGGKHALMSAADEQALRALGAPVRCCDYWPECSHVLAWYENRAGEPPADTERP